MDRDKELSLNYEDVSNMLERFKEKASARLEGRWFLVEKEGKLLKEIEDLSDEMEWQRRKEGYILTPLTIFRKT